MAQAVASNPPVGPTSTPWPFSVAITSTARRRHREPLRQRRDGALLKDVRFRHPANTVFAKTIFVDRPQVGPTGMISHALGAVLDRPFLNAER